MKKNQLRRRVKGRLSGNSVWQLKKKKCVCVCYDYKKPRVGTEARWTRMRWMLGLDEGAGCTHLNHVE